MKDEKRIKFIIVAIALVSLVIALTNFVMVGFLYRYSNDDCIWAETTHEGQRAFFIRAIVPDGMVDRAGILENDVLLKIDGRTFKTAMEAQFYINQFRGGHEVTYTIFRDGKVLEVDVVLRKNANTQVIIQSIVGFVFLFVGFMVVYTNPFQYMSRLFFYFMFVFFMFLFLNVSPPPNIFLSRFMGILRLIFVALWGPSILHFFLIFPRKWAFLKKRRWLIFIFYIPALAIFAVRMFVNIPNVILNAVIGIYMMAASASFFMHCSRITDEKEQRPLKIIKWGLLLGLIPLAALVFLNQLIIQILGLRIVFFAFSMMIWIPLTFGYAVMKYGLMDVSIVIKKSLIYSMVTVTFVVFYILFVVGLGGTLASQLGFKSQLFNFIFIGFTAIAINPVKNRIQDFVDRKFYRKRRNYQKMLLSLSQELPTLIQLNKILNMVSETLKKTLQVEKIVISVFESENNMYRVYNKEGVPESCECDFVEDAGGLSGLLIKRKDCISFYRIENDRDVSKLPSSDLHLLKEASIVLVVPMVYREELRGMILLGPKMSGEVYAQEDRDILLTVAGQTAVAVENARLYKQELERQREHEELELARKIQQDLLPNESPPMEGLEVWGCSSPATEVGGDYFDYIKKGTQSLLVFLGDVSGKGMPAALYMSKVQGMIQVAGAVYHSPKDIMKEVNRKIFEGIERKSFITMLSVLLDPGKKRAVICRAGHNPLLIFRARENRIEDVRPEGPGLGVVDGMAFDQKIEEVSVPFSTGDYFIIYSDGLTEAINPDRELFGEDRVHEIILKKEYSSPRELGELLMKSIGEYRQDAEQNDDITLVIVKIN